MRFGVLGPLVAEADHGPVDLKGPRHRAVLARLLIARGRVVPVDRLVDDLWGDPPDGAVGAIQTFVSTLRRALEPGRAPRTPARLLVTEPPGYALRAEPGAVDAWRFESLVTSGPRTLSRMDEALGLWRGPAYAEFADQAWARAEIARLDELRALAEERRAEALLALGRAAEAVPDLDAHVKAHSLREDGWRLLALALYRAGRQGDALAALRRARQVLVSELGIDPGPGLRRLEADILSQAPNLTPVQRTQLVGRDRELAQLRVAAAGVARGRLGLALVSGDAGAGKTALVEALSDELGWTTAWGRSPDGAPESWPWTQILTGLGAPAADPVVARFQWYRAVASDLAEVARRAPLLLVLDDLHAASAETLALLGFLVSEPMPERVLVVATHRTTDISPALAEFLGRAARVEPTRIYLGGLDRDAVSELVRTIAGRDVDDETTGVISQRSGGNPFFVRELACLIDSGLTSVPPGVRDVVRYRVARLPSETQAVLRRAAVIGRDVDLDVLEGLTGDVLDAVETAVRHGFLVESEPRRFQFAHALVHDAVYDSLSRTRRVRWHADVAEALEQLRPDDVESLAHHHFLAGNSAAVHYSRAAAEEAERRFAPHEAARLWQQALAADDGSDVRTRLDLTMGLVRALAVTGGLEQARHRRAEAIEIADSLGDPALTARVIGAFDVPAIWTEHDDPALAERIVEVVERTLAAVDDPADRSRLLATLALEARAGGGERARNAALEAEAIARELGDPTVLAFALNARFMQSFERAGLAPERARIGAELVELARRHTLVTFEVLGHLILVQAYSALADFPAADRHADAADRLGEQYQIPLIGVFTQWYQALRASLRGPAEAAYRAAAARLTGTGMSGVDNGILAFALLCQQVRRGEPVADGDFGGYEAWCRPLLGDDGPIPPSPRDLLFEARTCLHAIVVIRRSDRAAMERCYTELLPAAGELAGAGSGLVTLRPVAYYLGELATALGDPHAAEHYRRAEEIARYEDSSAGA
ncbi:BTAD domain-containing putative transcriptional regulator [Amycolatopsis sp. GM8]|uniref:BTAD domain-containing putative transcriptional regulator n=1 Tax=Amycolatopsis sp. GM8 TaxID=2896530 RepID=UPI001F392B09|nr:BTAD domain-containing putative transcriptional regulator [Amycolatopsis sp. GM8]